MMIFKTETEAFKVAGDKVVALCLAGKPNCGFRVLQASVGYKVLMVPERGGGLPFYLT